MRVRDLLAGALLAAAVALPAAADPTMARQKELTYRLRQDCGSCHGLTLKGGLGPALLPGTVAGKPGEVLVDIILHGIPGTPMPPWAFEITPEEARWLVARLRAGVDDGK